MNLFNCIQAKLSLILQGLISYQLSYITSNGISSTFAAFNSLFVSKQYKSVILTGMHLKKKTRV